MTLHNNCFFCSKKIVNKISKEHILPQSLLRELSIKSKTISSPNTKKEYSRIKVPAHNICNSTFGSRYENKIIQLLKDPNELYSKITKSENDILFNCKPENSTVALFSTWLLKIYYGLFYYDCLYNKDKKYKSDCKKIITNLNFKLIQKSYAENNGFYLPSSLYAYKGINNDFDLITNIIPQSILLKIKNITFVLLVADGHLSKNYLTNKILTIFKQKLLNEEKNNINYPSHKIFYAELLALRYCMPKQPNFVISDNKITNLSFMSFVKKPQEFYKINNKQLNTIKNKVLSDFGIKYH